MRLFAVLLLSIFSIGAFSQPGALRADTLSAGLVSGFRIQRSDSTHIPVFKPKRALGVAATETILASGSLVALSQLWYKDYPHTSFHTFNDNREWLQMDKIGHATTSYTVGRYGYDLLLWSGVKEKKAVWFGGLTGFAYLTVIEIFDGYSAGWGFSSGDMIANTSGSALFIGQQLLWHDQRIVLKFGFQRSGYAAYRPALLGKNLQEQVLKDYNGQTYWLSCNIASFLPPDNTFPEWLNIAFGYGANGMVGGHENPPVFNSSGNPVTFPRYRQFYISPDIDLTKIPVHSVFLRTLFNTFGFLKIPAPGIEISQGKIYSGIFMF